MTGVDRDIHKRISVLKERIAVLPFRRESEGNRRPAKPAQLERDWSTKTRPRRDDALRTSIDEHDGPIGAVQRRDTGPQGSSTYCMRKVHPPLQRIVPREDEV